MVGGGAAALVVPGRDWRSGGETDDDADDDGNDGYGDSALSTEVSHTVCVW
eukprot:CAMPEP_0181118940 /NCGR_PEP_ID=MMETSP1071-20121207/23342_1 /TAXON_ID=35127 /ORGANISM="Thalassiosira sp., Strain NH16" /LENGTH=50 /DNA_ID=CAMNT_0023203465 /DNA_START=84 /DNA_END=233 /DNA_ORIENTATION=-